MIVLGGWANWQQEKLPILLFLGLYFLSFTSNSLTLDDPFFEANPILERAEEGDTNAMGQLWFLLSSGHKKDLKSAHKWLHRCVELGDSDCLYIAGSSISQGSDGFERDYKLGKSLIRRAADGLHQAALYESAIMYLYGDSEAGIEKNETDAVNFFLLASVSNEDKGSFGLWGESSVNARYELGMAYMLGIGGLQKNYEEAFLWVTVSRLLLESDLMLYEKMRAIDSKVDTSAEEAQMQKINDVLDALSEEGRFSKLRKILIERKAESCVRQNFRNCTTVVGLGGK